MRFALGIVVGALLLVASAYLHDTRMARPGAAHQFVNWDLVIGMLGR